ncbi:MAG TPA: hypothetical protein VJS43_15845 [Candidatus Acidoferrales bacterium]|nr:hypothetical protein [Candidatus Acidoferrales bacterium]
MESAVLYLPSDVLNASNARINPGTTGTVTADCIARDEPLAKECGYEHVAHFCGPAVARPRLCDGARSARCE